MKRSQTKRYWDANIGNYSGNSNGCPHCRSATDEALIASLRARVHANIMQGRFLADQQQRRAQMERRP